jgi:hypothetical protein
MLPKNKVTKRDLNSHAHQLPTPNKRVDKPVHMYMSQILALGVRYFVCIIYIQTSWKTTAVDLKLDGKRESGGIGVYEKRVRWQTGLSKTLREGIEV